MRHVHLCKADVEKLFGKGTVLTSARPLSQPGQFLCNERVTIIGVKNRFESVGIIGPERKASQIEISRTDCFFLGVKDVPIRQSGDTVGAPTIELAGGVVAPVIVAKRHVHLDPKTAKENNLHDGQIVGIKFEGDRAATLGQTIVRVHADFAPAVHIDSDEANACLATNSVEIIAQII